MTEKNMWNLSPQEALKACQASEQGLTTEQAEKIRLEKGENVLLEEKKKSAFQVFLDQFKDLMVVILIGAAIISMFSGNEESTIVIFAVLVMNAVLGTVQHMKAEKSLESLKQLSAPDAKVIRDGRKQEIPAKDVVPGDILELEAGDMVAADGRILHNYSLQVNESSLTGESTNVDKQEMALNGEAALADRTNMVYSGSLVTYGRATVLVTATGMNTEIGKIAGADERGRRTENTVTEKPGSVQWKTGSPDHGSLCPGVCPLHVPENEPSGCTVICSSPGSSSDPGSTDFHRYHCPGIWNPENGKRKCHYQEIKGSGKLRLCICDLF